MEQFEKKVWIYSLGGLLIFTLILMVNPFHFIGNGEQAVVFNKFTSKTSTIGTGLRVVMPIVNRVRAYDLKVAKTDYNGVEGLSSDSQTIILNLTINWKIDGNKLVDIFKTIQGNIEDTIMYNAVVDTSKAELGKFRIDDIARNREVLRAAIQKALTERLAPQGIIVQNISVTNVDFNEAYETAINAKMIAQQQALEAKNLKDKKQYESEAKKIENQNMSVSITPMVLKQKWIEKWDGKLPSVMNGNGDMIYNMGTSN